MQNKRKHRYRPSRRHSRQPNNEHFLKKAYTAFCQLSEPAQTMVIVGLLLLLAWLITHPLLLATLLKVLLSAITIWVTLKQL
jgi:hypothetical protein